MDIVEEEEDEASLENNMIPHNYSTRGNRINAGTAKEESGEEEEVRKVPLRDVNTTLFYKDLGMEPNSTFSYSTYDQVPYT